VTGPLALFTPRLYSAVKDSLPIFRAIVPRPTEQVCAVRGGLLSASGKDWRVPSERWGAKERKLSKYLAPYIFRVALSNTALRTSWENGLSHFSLNQRSARIQLKSGRSAQELIRRFLQHVLPHAYQNGAT